MKKSGIIFISFTSNNVICSFTNLNGFVLAWTSAGLQRSKGLKKTVPSVVLVCITSLIKQVLKSGFLSIHLKLKGFNKSKKSIIKTIQQSKVKLLSYHDLTALPHNGCRKSRKKRY